MKQKKASLRQKIFIALFVGCLSTAFLVFNIFSRQLSTDNHENRFLTTLPDVLKAPIGQLPTALDAFFTDNSPFRYQLTALNAELNYRLLGSIDSTQVLRGKEGWLFYKTGPDGSCPLADYQGMLTYTPEQLAELAAGAQMLSDALAENGQQLVISFTPNKDTVYPEYLPDHYPVLHPDKLTDQVVAYLRENTTVAVRYDPEALTAHSREVPLYFKYDTHWNNMGALLALDPVLAQLGLETLPFEEYRFAPNGGQQGDMANVAALYNILEVEPNYLPENYPFQKDGRTVQVFGDSFSEYYMWFLSNRFSAASRSALTDLTTEAALGSNADVILVEVNERSVAGLYAQLCPGADTAPVKR